MGAASSSSLPPGGSAPPPRWWQRAGFEPSRVPLALALALACGAPALFLGLSHWPYALCAATSAGAISVWHRAPLLRNLGLVGVCTCTVAYLDGSPVVLLVIPLPLIATSPRLSAGGLLLHGLGLALVGYGAPYLLAQLFSREWLELGLDPLPVLWPLSLVAAVAASHYLASTASEWAVPDAPTTMSGAPLTVRAIFRDYFSPAQLPAFVRSTRFWMLYSMAAIPIVFDALGVGVQGMFFYFSLVWAVVFYRLVVPRSRIFSVAAVCYLVGALVSAPLELAYTRLPPRITEQLIDPSSGLASRLVGFIVGVGVREEVAKLLPVLLVIALARRGRRRRLTLREGLFLGAVAGLGFAAVENLNYLRRFEAVDALAGAHGVESHLSLEGTLARLLLTPFLHGAWSGIAGYFVAWGELAGEQREQMARRVAGIAMAATLHGLYDCLSGSRAITLFVIALTFHVFSRCATRAAHWRTADDHPVTVPPVAE